MRRQSKEAREFSTSFSKAMKKVDGHLRNWGKTQQKSEERRIKELKRLNPSGIRPDKVFGLDCNWIQR